MYVCSHSCHFTAAIAMLFSEYTEAEKLEIIQIILCDAGDSMLAYGYPRTHV